MYRILSASKDSYITDKYVDGLRCSGSNVGQAGTLDLFKLYNEAFVSLSASASGTIERSRALIQFDLSPVMAMTASGKINTSDSSFKTYLFLKDVYGGQTTPSNFTLRLIPLSRSWSEGRGKDVYAFRDLDAVNFLTASIVNGAPTLWVSGGASASGTLGATGIDIIVSGNLGSGLEDLTVSKTFAVGNEDLLLDVTRIVSGTLAGLIPDCGWRISFVDSEENDQTTRFVKRFGSRHTINKELRPRLIVKYNDSLYDDTGELEFDRPQKVVFYNSVNGAYVNFVSGAAQITGSSCATLYLYASRSVSYTTSSFSVSHNAYINHLTRSQSVITQSFGVSQAIIGSVTQTGIYSSSIDLNLASNATLRSFMSGATEMQFRFELLSLDGTYPFATGYYRFRKPMAGLSAVPQRNWIVNITNLKDVYAAGDVAKLRIFAQDYDADNQAYRLPTKTNSAILRNLKWRIVDAFSRKEIIPFDSEATVCSTDADGMYFELFMSDLEPGEVYEVEMCITENGQDYYINNRGFRFRVTK